MLRWITAAAIMLVLGQGALASPVLLGTVSLDKQIYTYSYTIDNSTGTEPIGDVAVLVDGINPRTGMGYVVTPLSETSPSGWGFAQTFSVDGSYFEWRTTSSNVLPQESLSGFSFSWYAAPELYKFDDYFLVGERHLYRGITIASNFGATPLPSTWALMLAGLVGMLLLTRVSRPSPGRPDCCRSMPG